MFRTLKLFFFLILLVNTACQKHENPPPSEGEGGEVPLEELPLSTTLKLTSSQSPSFLGDEIIFTASVQPSKIIRGLELSGIVTFKDSGNMKCESPVDPSSRTATCSFITDISGDHT